MLKVNFGGKDIVKSGYYASPWWDKVWKLLKRDRGYTDEQATTFLNMTDTLIRLDLYPEHFWRGRDVK